MFNSAVLILDLYKKIDKEAVLNDFNLTIRQGEIHVIAGSTGAGKTTLLNILAGTVQPTNGTVKIFNKKAGSMEIRKRIGYVPAKPAFYPLMTVLDYLVYMGMLSGLEQTEAISRAVFFLKKVELNTFRDKYPTDISPGMKRKIAIAQGMLSEPSLLLLDEPVTGLEQTGKESILQIIHELVQDRNMTVIVTAAQWTDVSGIADTVTIVHEGRSVLSDETANIRDFFNQGIFLMQTSNNNLLLEALRRTEYLKYIVRSEKDIITVITGQVERLKKDLPGILYKLQLELIFFRQEELNMENVIQYLL
ncbi:MAG: putative ABC transporter ATP-binding protein YxlF [Candidatus Dichloromethanomonas elyunquensis]|nr:MAG: putative ABC transporter ATP-binding protein YxlF [Candidatus Dichloromethanomonas elyunquensis]